MKLPSVLFLLYGHGQDIRARKGYRWAARFFRAGTLPCIICRCRKHRLPAQAEAPLPLPDSGTGVPVESFPPVYFPDRPAYTVLPRKEDTDPTPVPSAVFHTPSCSPPRNAFPSVLLKPDLSLSFSEPSSRICRRPAFRRIPRYRRPVSPEGRSGPDIHAASCLPRWCCRNRNAYWIR